MWSSYIEIMLRVSTAVLSSVMDRILRPIRVSFFAKLSLQTPTYYSFFAQANLQNRVLLRLPRRTLT